jgi:hypothetical protein
MLANPILHGLIAFTLGNVYALDCGPGFAYLPDFILGHFSDPQHSMPLQPGMREIDRAFVGILRFKASTVPNRLPSPPVMGRTASVAG